MKTMEIIQECQFGQYKAILILLCVQVDQELTSLLDLGTSLRELDENNVAERLLGVVGDTDSADVGGIVERDPLVLLGETLLNTADSDAGSKAGTKGRCGEGLGCRTDGRPAEKLNGGANSSEHFVQ